MKLDHRTRVYVAGCGGMLDEAVYHLFRSVSEIKATDIDVNTQMVIVCRCAGPRRYCAVGSRIPTERSPAAQWVRGNSSRRVYTPVEKGGPVPASKRFRRDGAPAQRRGARGAYGSAGEAAAGFARFVPVSALELNMGIAPG
jgi:hypothetical protein